MRFARDTDPSLLIWKVPAALTTDEASDVQTFVLPVMGRPGGALYAAPDQVLSSEVMRNEMLSESPELLGIQENSYAS